jgi:hypothetical protein
MSTKDGEYRFGGTTPRKSLHNDHLAAPVTPAKRVSHARCEHLDDAETRSACARQQREWLELWG